MMTEDEFKMLMRHMLDVHAMVLAVLRGASDVVPALAGLKPGLGLATRSHEAALALIDPPSPPEETVTGAQAEPTSPPNSEPARDFDLGPGAPRDPMTPAVEHDTPTPEAVS